MEDGGSRFCPQVALSKLRGKERFRMTYRKKTRTQVFWGSESWTESNTRRLWRFIRSDLSESLFSSLRRKWCRSPDANWTCLNSQVKVNIQSRNTPVPYFPPIKSGPWPHVALEVTWGRWQEHTSVLTRGCNKLKADNAVSLFCVFQKKNVLIAQLCCLSTYFYILYFGHHGYFVACLKRVMFYGFEPKFACRHAHRYIRTCRLTHA